MLSTPSTGEKHCTTSVHFVLHWQLTIVWNTYGGTSDLNVRDEAGYGWRNKPLILLPWACMRLAQCHCCTQQESSKSGFPSHLASLCACGQAFIIVQTQLLTGEVLDMRTSISWEEARLGISVGGFWRSRLEQAFFDVRVFNPSAPTNWSQQMTSIYCKHEQEKHKAYEQQFREVERASFTPLVFAASGRMGKAATIFHKWLAALLAQKRHQPYSTTMGWLRTGPELRPPVISSAVPSEKSSQAITTCH